MKDEKRKVKSYKVADSVYQKAKKKARKEKTTLANKIENFVTDYSKSY